MRWQGSWSSLLVVLVTVSGVRAQDSTRSLDPDAWQQDVRVITEELPRRHPNLFYRMTRAAWDSAGAAIERRLPTMNRDQTITALMEWVALVQDGHTTINPMFDRALGARYYPVDFFLFEDGLFVRAAAPKYERWVGARVLRVGRAGADDALARVARTIPAENEWWRRAWAPQWLAVPEVVDGVGLADDPDRLTLTVERDGKPETLTLEPAGRIEPHGHNPMASIDRSGWVDMRGPGAAPLWLRNPGRPYWMEYVAGDRTLYACDRAVVDAEQPPSNGEFWKQVFAFADSAGVDRLIIDLRENVGGNSFLNREVVRGIVAHPAVDRPGHLFVIIGRKTFSAAMNLVLDLEQWTRATFVGEPTGNATVFFGDHDPLVLPRSGISVNVSTLPWYPYDPRDRRPFVAPSVYAPLTSAQYRANVDPAMQAILDRASKRDWVESVEAAVALGDTAAAARTIEQAKLDVANRFRNVESDVNELGYSLLRAKRTAAAVAVLGLDAQAYPASANAWDSLGEALLAADRREESIAAYRRALGIDPGLRTSREALARLGFPAP
ncbi:MAG: hypothetical protein U0167_05270 [bacterium]